MVDRIVCDGKIYLQKSRPRTANFNLVQYASRNFNPRLAGGGGGFLNTPSVDFREYLKKNGGVPGHLKSGRQVKPSDLTT